MRISILVLLGLSIGALGACGGSSASNGSGGAAGATGGSGGTTGGSGGTTGGSGGVSGSGINSGDCVKDGDCPNGKCVELVPGGYRVCVVPVPEATACQNQSPGVDECCTSAECAEGKCYAFPAKPSCGGALPVDQNVCASNDFGCDQAGTCPINSDGVGVCMPAGAYGYKVAACLAVGCQRDTDCSAEAGGQCLPIEDPCCGAPNGLYCVYPNDGCHRQADCAVDQHCEVGYDTTKQQNIARCVAGSALCPL